MNLRITPKPEGFKRLRMAAEALKLTNGDRQTVVLRTLDSVHNQQIRRAFASRGASVESGPWPAWSPRYAKWRTRHRGRLGNRMMRLTDSLYEKSSFPNHAGHIAEWRGGLRYAFGFTDDVGYMHQQGGPILPKRSLVDKTPRDQQEFLEAFTDFYQNRIRQVTRHL